jgi:hypothetical protein
MSNNVYIIDACALIDASKNYPLDMKIFQNIWKKIAEMFENNKLISSAEIFKEVKDNNLEKWLKPYKKCFLPLDEKIQDKTKEILKDYPKLININKNNKSTSNGDPFLIATAMVNNGIIVTNEKRGENKIPNISSKFGIQTIDLNKFIREIME